MMDGLTYDARFETYKRLSQLQSGHKKWLDHNFPDQLSHHGLLGVVEEVGELTHAHLKSEQGIRYVEYSQAQEDIADAIGDIIIYLMSYCNSNGFDIGQCLERAWEEVRQRDWRADPTKGINTPHTELSTGTASSGEHSEGD